MNEWDQWIQKHAKDGGLLQSKEWGEFQRALGRRVERIESRILNLEFRALVVEQQLPLGQTYVYSPRGPVLENSEFRILNLELLIEIVRKKFPQAIFWRVEPTDPTFKIRDSKFSIVRCPQAVQPATTLIIDLIKTEEEILAQMKQKTRYNIKVAEKHSVVVRREQNPEAFLDLLEETAKRDGFRTHAREYYKKLLNIFPERSRSGVEGPSTTAKAGQASSGYNSLCIELFCTFQGDALLAGAIVAFFGQWAYYLHGASSSLHRDMMAPYLLHWEIMREAKRRGCTRYDLWGAGDQWPGVSKFKTGFAPATPLTHYPGTFDVVLNPWKYWVYRLVQKIK